MPNGHVAIVVAPCLFESRLGRPNHVAVVSLSLSMFPCILGPSVRWGPAVVAGSWLSLLRVASGSGYAGDCLLECPCRSAQPSSSTAFLHPMNCLSLALCSMPLNVIANRHAGHICLSLIMPRYCWLACQNACREGCSTAFAGMDDRSSPASPDCGLYCEVCSS